MRNVRATSRYKLLAHVAVTTVFLAACTGPQSTATSELGVVDTPSTTVAVESDRFGVSEASVVVGDFFDALNSGGQDEVFGLLAEDAVVIDSLAGELGPAEATNWLVWRIAQGTLFGDVECAPGEADSYRIVVPCTTGILDALGAATNTPPATADVTFELGSGGISAVDFSYQPTVGEAPSMFVDWLQTQYPDDPDAEAAAAVWGDSVDVSRERGEQRAEFAQLWVDFALAAVEETFSAYENKDLEGFLNRWGEGDTIIGNNRLSEPRWFEADFESGPSYSLESCVPEGLFTGVILHCTGSTTDLFGGRSGIVQPTDWVFIVDETGKISSTTDLTDYQPLERFGNQFQEWMTTNYPAVQDSVDWVRPWLAAAEDWETVRPYVDEFVAQSDDYPIDS